jgi:hypothetical protein
MGACSRTQKPVVPWVRLEIGFYSLFVLPKGRDVSQVQTDISWEREVSPWPIITFGTSCSPSFKSPLSMIALTAIRDRDYEVHSMTASC